jgi:hypothetical protein
VRHGTYKRNLGDETPLKMDQEADGRIVLRCVLRRGKGGTGPGLCCVVLNLGVYEMGATRIDEYEYYCLLGCDAM